MNSERNVKLIGPRRKRRWVATFIGLFVLGVMVVAGFHRQPASRGKTVNGWLDQAASETTFPDREILAALREMGADAVPYKIKALVRTDSAVDRWYRSMYPRLPERLQKQLHKPANLELRRLYAFQALRENEHTRTHLTELLALLKHKDTTIRRLAINIIVHHMQREDTYCLSPLSGALRDSDEEVRWRAAEGLAVFGGSGVAAVLPLRRALTDSAPMVRIASAWALAQIDTNALALAIPVLQEVMSGDELRTQVFAAARCAQLTDGNSPEAIRVLLTAMIRKTSDARGGSSIGQMQIKAAQAMAQGALVEFGVQRTNVMVELERAAAFDPDLQVRSRAQLVLLYIEERRRRLETLSRK